MEKLSIIEESLPSILLYLPEKLLNEDPKGEKEKYRQLYIELVDMGSNINLERLVEIQEELSNNEATFTRHGNEMNDIQDWWFGTRRVEGDTYLIVLYGMVSAYIHAMTDLNNQDHNLDADKLNIIYAGLSQMAEVSFEYLYKEINN